MSIQVYEDMLTYCRPHKSRTERAFIKRFLLSLPGASQDTAGNVQVHIASPNGVPSNVLWSAHTDTVHRVGGRQAVVLANGFYKLRNPACGSGCLGADNTSGVWLLHEMILAGVPGHYVFHRGEECGGIGSRWLAASGAAWLSDCRFAIAFDRCDYSSVITRQMGQRCCSDAFALQLAAALGVLCDSEFKPDDGGVYTDTAEYTQIIPECTNVSVGYKGAHSAGECQSQEHLLKLRFALLHLDMSTFSASRNPADVEYDDLDWAWRSSRYSGGAGASGKGGGSALVEYDAERETIAKLVRAYPDEIAALIRDEFFYSAEDVIDSLIYSGADLSIYDIARYSSGGGSTCKGGR